MHGRVKVRTTAEQEKIKEAERQKKAKEFQKGIELVFQKRKNQEWDDEIMFITERILTRNPDVYTLWNIRREAFSNSVWSEDERTEKLEKELSLTEMSLRENPKSYCVWHQRTWVIERIPNPNWKRELDLCSKCLNLDERNFHCWYYRHYVVCKANVPDSEELEYTTSKILNNFSNYSSWHYRSKLLKKLYPSNVHDLPIRADKHDEELDLVMNATFTDPNDSSAWFYQRWLLHYSKSPLKLWQAVLTEKRITVAFHKEVPLNLDLLLNNQKINCQWKSVNGKKYSVAWYATFEKPLTDNYDKVSLKFEENIYELKLSNTQNTWVYKSEILSGNHNNPKLNEQLENYQTLLSMEPSNKWAKLTSMYLMLIINSRDKHSNIMKQLSDLIRVDPLRANYYKDMRSKYILEYILDYNSEVEKNNCDIVRDIDLSSKEFTTLSSQGPYLTFYHSIDLSNNFLGSKLYQLENLQECVKLDLSNNNITSLRAFPTLQSLKILLLSENQIKNSEEVYDLITRHSLTKLNLRGNLIPNIVSLVNEIGKNFPNLEVVF